MASGLKLYLLPVLLLIALTVPHLEQGDFRRDTVRYAAIGHHMWAGGSLGTPYLTAEKPYFNKPPMALWVHGLFLKVFGPHLAVARVPSILAAIGVVVLSMCSVRMLGTQSEAITSGIVLATTYEFFRRTREISLDLWQLFFIMGAVFLVTRAIRDGARWPVILSGIPLGLALLCKPLVALITIPIFAIWLGMSGRARLITWLAAGALPIALLVAAPWHIHMYFRFGSRFTNHYFVSEVMNRALRSDQQSTIFYYLKENAFTYWPWMLALLYAAYLTVKKPAIERGRFVFLALVWVLVSLVVLSGFPDRKPNYALVLYPMLAWIAAWAICRIPQVNPIAWMERNFRRLVPTLAIVFLVACLAPIQFQQPAEKNWVALIDWIKTTNIDAAQLVHANIDQNDVCYVYLKTGKWMKSLRRQNGGGTEGRERMLLTKFLGKTKPLPGQEIFFRSGPVYVVSQPVE
jgi:4-amino-4-deoxy-L-arabinose transferase-like glycosyltransferase